MGCVCILYNDDVFIVKEWVTGFDECFSASENVVFSSMDTDIKMVGHITVFMALAVRVGISEGVVDWVFGNRRKSP